MNESDACCSPSSPVPNAVVQVGRLRGVVAELAGDEALLLTRPALSNGCTPTASLLLEGRARLTASFIGFSCGYQPPAGTQPKSALALAAYARTHPVIVTTTSSQVIDLGICPPAAYLAIRPCPLISCASRRERKAPLA